MYVTETKQSDYGVEGFFFAVVCQANAYTNATFCITSARSGWDDGHFELIAGSCIINPEGVIIAESKTLDDELVVAEIDLDDCLWVLYNREKEYWLSQL